MEYNSVRPFTYSHFDTLPGLPNNSVANYSHVNQPLAHPLGANFNEFIFLCRYKPTNRLYMSSKVLLALYGENKLGQNNGGNILLPNESRINDYGNFIGQGIKTNIFAINLDMSYEFYHNYFLDLNALFRQSKTNVIVNQHYLGGGIRINMANVSYDY